MEVSSKPKYQEVNKLHMAEKGAAKAARTPPWVTEPLRWLSSLDAKRALALPAGYMQSSRNATFPSPALG